MRRTMAALIVLAVFLAGMSSLLVWRHGERLRAEQEALLSAVGRSVAEQIGLALDYGIPFDAIRGMDAFLDTVIAINPDLASVSVRSADGREVFRRGRAVRAGDHEVAVAIVSNTATVGTVHLAATTGWGPRLILLAELALASGTILGAAALMLRHHRRHRVDPPLARLDRRLTAAAGGDVSAPPAPLSGRDEIGRLDERVATILERINVRHAAFLQNIAELAAAQPTAASRSAVERLGRETLADWRFRETS